MRGGRLTIDRSKRDTQHAASLAKGGNTRMLPKQAAGPAPRGHTAKSQPAPPGPKAARGGHVESKPRSAKPATPGRTGSR